MEFDQLEAFIAVARTMNFTKAAEQLNIVQSSVTARIKTLEDNIGKRLFDRGTRHVKLTPAGEALLPFAEKTLDIISEGMFAVKSQTLFDERLSVGGLNSIWNSSIYKQMLLFKMENPKVALHLVTGHSNEINQKIQEELLDVGFVYIPPRANGFEVIPIKEETISLFASPILAQQRKEVSKNELLSLPFVHYNWGSPFNEWYETEFAPHGIAQLRVDHFDLAMKIILELQGIGFILNGLVQDFVNEGQLVPITLTDANTPLPKREIYLVYLSKNRKKKALDQFINIVNEQK
jgi:DNA-binding transcriptional LysR family regulator